MKKLMRYILMQALVVAGVVVWGTLGYAASPAVTGAGMPETSAVSAILMDSSGTILFEKDSHKRLPPASVTKTMTLLLAVEAVEQGRVALDEKVAASETSWRQGGSQIWLEPGEALTVREMMTAVAVVSANDAAVALMEHIYGSEAAGVAAMNEKATALGLKDTHFNNVNGLPTPDHYMSAYDTARIACEAVQHPLYRELCSIKEFWLRDGKSWLVNTNKLLWWYKGADGLKTGWTEEAKYCFVGTAVRDGLRLIAVVFATPEPRSHLREAMKLLDWGYANYTAIPVIKKGETIDVIPLQKGIESSMALLADRDIQIVVRKNQRKEIQKEVIIQPAITAPIDAGQKYGEIVVRCGGTEVAKANLIADKSIPRAGFLDVLKRLMGNLFQW